MNRKPEDYNSLEEKFYEQNEMIEALQRDHSRLDSELKYLEDQNNNLQVKRNPSEKTFLNKDWLGRKRIRFKDDPKAEEWSCKIEESCKWERANQICATSTD